MLLRNLFFNTKTLSTLSALCALSACSLGPITPTKGLPRSEEFYPGGHVRKVPGLYFELITNVSDSDWVGSFADQIYQNILADTKLSQSSKAFSLYPLYYYQSREEYLTRSGMPNWSDGVFRHGSILTHRHQDPIRTKEVLAHEISHLIFWEFFGSSRRDLLWLNEGLAMYEDSKVQKTYPQDPIDYHRKRLKENYTPLIDLTQVQSAREHKPNEAEIFYIESWFLVKFLIERGGSVGFFEMLKALRDGKSLHEALALGFFGKWQNLEELEFAFRKEYRIE